MRVVLFQSISGDAIYVSGLRNRLRAGAIHFAISLALACISAAVVFGIWFPGAFREIGGGRELFLLMTSVDVVLGPLLTVAIFDLRKGWPVVRKDLAVIGCLQILALSYGVYVTSEVRPVALVFEVDRFKLIAANDILARELPLAEAKYRSLPWNGPWLLSTRQTRADEVVTSVDLAMQGFDIAQRPVFWQPYELAKASVWRKGRPIDDLIHRYPAASKDMENRLAETKMKAADVRYLPLTGKSSSSWVAFVGPGGDLIGFAPYDGLF